MATDISKLGGLIQITQTGFNAVSYTIDSLPPYQFNSNNELIFAGYVIPLVDLRIAGSGTAPVNLAAAQTALDALFPEAGGSASTTYLVYTALLTQSGTDAPVATVLENTLGGAVVWTRDTDGTYVGTATGLLTANKTAVLISNGNSIDDVVSAGEWTAGDAIFITTALFLTPVFVATDSRLIKATIEIRVYP